MNWTLFLGRDGPTIKLQCCVLCHDDSLGRRVHYHYRRGEILEFIFPDEDQCHDLTPEEEEHFYQCHRGLGYVIIYIGKFVHELIGERVLESVPGLGKVRLERRRSEEASMAVH